jgi:hypothetical protein
MHVICGVQNPEDLAVVPDTPFVVVSQFGTIQAPVPGGLALLDTSNETLHPLFPQAGIGREPLASGELGWGDARCKGAPDRRISPHGIDLRARDDGRIEVYVVNHGGREAVELFELSHQEERWTLGWRGCVPMAEGVVLNDVAGLPDGGFVATSMFSARTRWERDYQTALAAFGVEAGHVLEWHPAGALEKVPFSDAALPNGIAASPDGRELFVNIYMGNEVRRIERESGKLLGRVSIPHPDNITWSGDGRLLVASHQSFLDIARCGQVERGACSAAFEIVALDPRTLEAESIFTHEGAPMGAGTVAVPMGQELFIGSFRSDRLARVPYRTSPEDQAKAATTRMDP